MKRFLLSVTSLGLLLAGVGSIVSSCSHEERASSDDDNDQKIVINNFDVEAVSKSASACYRVSVAGDTAYLTVSSNIQWPTIIGGKDIKVFQDSILSLAYPVDRRETIDASIRSFVSDIHLQADSASVARVDRVPAEATEFSEAYEISVSGKLLEISESLVTYQVSSYSYTGGAHSNMSSCPFTYSLAEGKVLTLSNLFKPGYEDALTGVIRESLARQFNVPASHLTAAGFFSDNIPVSDMIYVINGSLMFHYNSYDIAPHSMGSVDVEVYPYEIESYLTKLGIDILINR